MNKKNRRIISIFLVAIVTFNVLPINVMAGLNLRDNNENYEAGYEPNFDNSDNEIELPKIKQQTKEAKIVGEITEERTINEKRFLMSDGTIQIAVYSDAVHYEDVQLSNEVKKVYKNIDNSLIESKKGYKLKDNSLDLEFAKNENSFTFKNKNYTLSWSLRDSKKAKADVKNNDEIISEQEIQNSFTNSYDDYLNSRNNSNSTNTIAETENEKIKKENEKKLVLSKTTSEVTYKNVLNNLDIKYKIVGNKVKESIVLNDKTAVKNEYVYNVNITSMENLEKIQNSNNEITLIDSKTKEIVFIISAPYMFDANGEYSDSITLELKDNELIMTVDEEWLNSEKRVFPIVIDPEILTSQHVNAIDDMFIYNTGVNAAAHILRVGTESGSSLNPFRSIIKWQLPEIGAGDQVVNAELFIASYHKTNSSQNPNDYPNPPSNVAIDIHKMLVDWDESTTNYSALNNGYNSSKIENNFIYNYDNNNPNKFASVNITNVVKDWYVNGGNYGIMLKEHGETVKSGRTDARFLSSNTNEYAYGAYRPVILIQYRNQTGLEDYMTYHSYDTGRAGTVYTNDYNGNVTLIHNDASTPGSRFPATVYHVYNSNDKYAQRGYGTGWRLNLNQSIKPIDIGGTTYLQYIDENATRHYFYNDNSIWKDEDGLNLEVTFGNDIYTMTDKDGNKYRFVHRFCYEHVWALDKIEDTSGNSINIEFHDSVDNNTLISKVTDGAGNEINFSYNGSHLGAVLLSITDTNNRTTNFSYNASNLGTIYYPDGETTEYSYDGLLLTQVNNIDDSYVDLEYYPTSPNRAKSIKEYGTNSELGNTISISYSENITKFTDNNGILVNYLFNNYGQTISVTNNVNNLSAAYGKSYQYDNSTDKKKNKLVLETDLIKPTNNLIANGSTERLWHYWEFVSWGLTPTNCNFSSDDSYFGNGSIKCVATNYTSYPTIQKSLYVSKGSTYTLSSWIKSTNQNVQLGLYYYDVNGEMVFSGLTKLNSLNTWDRYSVSIDYPSNAASPIYLLLGAVGYIMPGTVYFDGIQFENEEIANTYNLLENGNFKYGDSYWIRSGLDGNDITTNNSFKITGNGGFKNLSQNVYLNGNQGDVFSYSGFVKSNGVPTKIDVYNKITEIRLNIRCNNGTNYWVGSTIDPSVNDWQYVNGKFITNCPYNRIDYYIAFDNNYNDAYFSNLAFYKDISGNSYQYDNNGNVISVKDNANQSSTLNYNINNQLISNINPKGSSFNYTYDTTIKDRLTEAKNNNSEVKYNLGYDSFGNNNYLKVSSQNTNNYIETGLTYTSNGNFLTKVTDQRGKETNYTNNVNTGTLTNSINANNVQTSYTYDTLDKMTSVSTNNITTSYTYTNDYLSVITHNNFSYNLNYDVFGNLNNIKVGDQNLLTNNYATNNGNLTSSVYGNNQTISYAYDNLDRLFTKTKQDKTYNYLYDNFNNIAKIKDITNNIEYSYTYDLASRLNEYQTNNFGIKFSYDDNSNFSKKENFYQNNNRTVDYTFDKDSKPTSVSFGSNKLISYTYDALDRLSDQKINNTYTTNYNYSNLNNNKTTTLIQSVSNNGNILSYEYDDIGNIISITVGNNLINEYEYDQLNQLIIDKDYVNNKKYEFNYDSGGNITSKVIKNLTTDVIINTITYSYGNSVWKDQLTSYNGLAITYDNIGNPTSIGTNISLTWRNGRELATYIDTSTSQNISYNYNDSGIRTSKTVNGTETKYYLEGSKVIYEQKGTALIYYIYDSNDNIIGLEYNNNTYYYVKNGQNDIIGLLDSNLNQIVSYQYDSWGKIISVKDNNNNEITDTNNIGIINPYKYRSYRYDTETGIYYLNSRYYNPEWGRFLNSDSVDIFSEEDTNHILINNLYTYSFNNPVNLMDPDGDIPILAIAFVALTIYDIYITIKNPTKENIAWTLAGIIPIGKIGKVVKPVAKIAQPVAKVVNGYKNKRLIQNTLIKGYKVSMDLERGGSGLVNIHVLLRNTKYFYKNGKWINSLGKEIPNALRNNSTIQSALKKAQNLLKGGW